MSEIETQLAETHAALDQAEYDLAVAQALEAYWKQRHADAWILIGRLDLAFEKITLAQGIKEARGWARRMRNEIKDKVGK